MKPEKRAKYAAAITLSKGKMYEYGVPEDDHLELPEDLVLEMQFPLAVGTLGDFASETIAHFIDPTTKISTSRAEIVFAGQVLQAYDDSFLIEDLAPNLRLLSAAGFYLGDIPGNSSVEIAKLGKLMSQEDDPLAHAVQFALDKPWVQKFDALKFSWGSDVLDALVDHFMGNDATAKMVLAVKELRKWAYGAASAHELLMADLLSAICITRIANSAWTLLPFYSELPSYLWKGFLSRPPSIKEMWPSQRLLGEANVYRGQSGVVQMPTSAGKSRATELIIRSAILSGRTKLALVIAPFRALCQEISSDLEKAFKYDGYEVNQPSDAMQSDIDINIFNVDTESNPQIVVLTPEKLLYILRQEPEIIQKSGLVVYDEGHQFDTGTRGVTYELLLTSIKRLLPVTAQSVLISAVIQNAASIAEWLLKDNSKVVSDKTLQARRLIAFASLPVGKDGQLQFNVSSEIDQKFFVPRVISIEKQPRLPRETADRFFPTQESGSIALYLSLKLLGNGGVAIYAGRKDSAIKIVRDAVNETFRRGISLAPPSTFSNADEIRRFVNLFEKNFGNNAYLTKAAAIGIFAHHGNTPHGVRLAIEYAMRQRYISLIVCTSTLAQGVNLPIRYLLVTSAMQGRESIKSRDFHNLMGRAGRAGMYGEGTVIFTDHRLYDERVIKSRRWDDSINLINAESPEPTGSTLLSLFDPIQNDIRTLLLVNPSPVEIATSIVNEWEVLYVAVGSLSAEKVREKFTVDSIRKQLRGKKRIIEAIESFLMTYRSDDDSGTFINNSKALASETLAYSLASPEQKNLLIDIFAQVAQRIEKLVPKNNVQHRFGRTLLGIDNALAIDAWVADSLQTLENTDSPDELMNVIYPLLVELSVEKRFVDTTPSHALEELLMNWLAGNSFVNLLHGLDTLDASYPHGKQRRNFDIDQVVDLCEQTFGFEFSLLLAAVNEAFAATASDEVSLKFKGIADLLQKRLKYGLPNQECIAYFESGFSERVIAQELSNGMMFANAKNKYEVRNLVREYAEYFEHSLNNYPSHFSEIFRTIVAPEAE